VEGGRRRLAGIIVVAENAVHVICTARLGLPAAPGEPRGGEAVLQIAAEVPGADVYPVTVAVNQVLRQARQRAVTGIRP